MVAELESRYVEGVVFFLSVLLDTAVSLDALCFQM